MITASSNQKLSVAGNVHSLTLTHAGVDEAGTYSVTVANVAGETESSAKLDVGVEGTLYRCSDMSIRSALVMGVACLLRTFSFVPEVCISAVVVVHTLAN